MEHAQIPWRFSKIAGRAQVFGHRGASAGAPENTLAAFELALAQGADGIEFDVRLSTDGVPVVIHDARLERTTSGRGPVRRHTFAALRRLDAGAWFNERFPEHASARFTGAKIPSLAETLAWVRTKRCAAFVEIKTGRPLDRGVAGKVVEEIHRARVTDLVTVISFHAPTLRRVRELDAGLKLGLDCMRPIVTLARARRLGATTVLPHGTYTKARWVARAHRAGLRVVVWGVDEPAGMLRLLRAGVDGIITSSPATLRALGSELPKD